MKTLYRVTIRSLDPKVGGGETFNFAASNPHYAVREVLFAAGRKGALPRGWKRLRIEVSR